MPAITPAALRTHITAGTIAPLYLIDGGDDAEKTSLAAAFMESVEADLRAFNVERLYGGEPGVTASSVIAARTLPMMAPRRIVLVLRAEKLLMPKRESDDADRDSEMWIGPSPLPSRSPCSCSSARGSTSGGTP